MTESESVVSGLLRELCSQNIGVSIEKLRIALEDDSERSRIIALLSEEVREAIALLLRLENEGHSEQLMSDLKSYFDNDAASRSRRAIVTADQRVLDACSALSTGALGWLRVGTSQDVFDVTTAEIARREATRGR